MSKDNKLQLLSPLFLKHQADFEKNPRSRVFAPLAETYRKLGMTDKAMEILSQGIRNHPTYVMGYLGLAFCYFDLKQYNLAYSTLRPLTEANRDNLRLQKLFSDVCLELGKQEEALETLKYLLFINPRDKEVAAAVSSLEHEVENKYKHQHKPIIIPEREFASELSSSNEENSLFNVEKLAPVPKSESNDFDDWMAIDLSHEKKDNETSVNVPSQAITTTTNFDHWNVKKVDQALRDEPEVAKETREFNLNLDDEEKNSGEFYDEINLDLDSSDGNDDAPLVTHTLVDLYCGQGHIEKALEVLEKILLLNPKDQKTIKKIKEIQALVQPLEQYNEVEVVENNLDEQHFDNTEVENADVSEEDGRRHLMSLIDEKLGPIEIDDEDSNRRETINQIEDKLTKFLKKIQKRALDYQGRV